MSARYNDHDVVLGLEAGCNDYITKPVRSAELNARINVQVGGRRAEASALTLPLQLRLRDSWRKEIEQLEKKERLTQEQLQDAQNSMVVKGQEVVCSRCGGAVPGDGVRRRGEVAW